MENTTSAPTGRLCKPRTLTCFVVCYRLDGVEVGPAVVAHPVQPIAFSQVSLFTRPTAEDCSNTLHIADEQAAAAAAAQGEVAAFNKDEELESAGMPAVLPADDEGPHFIAVQKAVPTALPQQ